MLVKPTSLKPGRYRHYKGKDYQVTQVACHSETGEHVVVYRCLYGDYSWWVRPLAMFAEQVTVEGKALPRFLYVGAMTEQDIIQIDRESAGV